MPENAMQETPVVETPVVETPAAPEMPAAEKKEKTVKKTVKAKKTTDGENDLPTVMGMSIEVIGRAVSLSGLENYSTTVLIPRRENWKQYLRAAVERKLMDESAAIQGVQTTYVDEEEEVMVPVSFFDKNVMELKREEIFPVAAYYGLRGLKKMQDKRAACISIYRQLCDYLGLEKPMDEGAAKKWAPLVLKPVRCPQGDTVMPEVDPIAFIDHGSFWEKTFMKRK